MILLFSGFLLYIFYILPSQHGLVVKRKDPFYISPVISRETLDIVTSIIEDDSISNSHSFVKPTNDSSNRGSTSIDFNDNS